MLTLLEASANSPMLLLPLSLAAIGIFLLILEVTVIPGFGFAGIIGILLLGGGIFLGVQELTVHTFEVSPTSITAVGISLASSVGLCGLFVAGLVKLMPRIPGVRKVMLDTALDRSPLDEGKLQHLHSFVGSTGLARTDLRPAGKVSVQGREFDVVTQGGYISAGEQVLIAEVREGHLVVSRLS